jgi:hypothetical protein
LNKPMITVPVPEPGRVVILCHDVPDAVVVTHAIKRVALMADALRDVFSRLSVLFEEVPDDPEEVTQEQMDAVMEKYRAAAGVQFLALTEYINQELYPGEEGPGQMVADINSLGDIGIMSPEAMKKAGVKFSGSDITGGSPGKGH